MAKNTLVVEHMFNLLNQYKVTIPTEDIVALEDLKNLQIQYAEETASSSCLFSTPHYLPTAADPFGV